MSTNNNATQTLFRFATMRNPELSNPKDLDKRFIFRNSTLKSTSVFDTNLAAQKTLSAICAKIDTQNIALQIFTEDTLKSQYGKFYETMVWIARNKSVAAKTEFDAKITACKSANGVPVIDSKLWDNLVYQVITQKDFYVKEFIMQLLHLAHILQNYDMKDEMYQNIVRAKVVLPKELFKTDTSGLNGGNASRISGAVIEQTLQPQVMYNDKSMKFAEAKVRLMENQKLSDALAKVEKSYRREYQDAYQKSYDTYMKESAPIKNEYQSRLSEAESRKKFLEGRIQYLTEFSISNPEYFLRDERLPSELKELNDGLAKLQVPPVEFAEFSFDYRPEVSADSLQKSLSAEHLSTLAKVMGTDSFATGIQGISSFNDLNESISQNNLALQQQVLNNTELNTQVSASVGGMLIPVTNTVNSNGWIPYSVKTYSKGSSDWFIMLTVDNYTSNIVSGSYKVTLNGTEIASTNIFQAVSGVNFLFYNGTSIPAAQTVNTGGFVLQGEVVLDDGKTYSLNVTLTRDSSEIDRILKQGVFKGSSAFTPVMKPVEPENPGTPVIIPSNAAAFIPSGFGMRNIGVADYLKVEQSLQGYIEGEVAHIENVMARERREKSTKKTSRSEITTMESSDTEKEQLRDTSTADRFELQNEISKAIQNVKDANVSAYVNGENTYPSGSINYGVSGGFSTHNSKEENTRQAMTQAKEITQKATDRVVTKVHKERTEKMIEEFEESNIHEFDNRKGDKHVVGVYRWVDKIYKNQIYNYGKRMMFEFMIPEPAKLHNLGMKISKNAENLLIKPVDPRESTIHKIATFASLNDDTILKFWLSKYNVEVDEFPMATFSINKSFHERDSAHTGKDDDKVQVTNGSGEVEIPDGYVVDQVTYTFNTYPHGFKGSHQAFITIAGNPLPWIVSANDTQKNGVLKNLNVKDKLAFSFATGESPIIEGSLDVRCNLTAEAKNAWLQKTFNKIIEAYEKVKTKYDQDLAAIQAQGVQIKGSNPGFYRQIENTILRRNCISYMINQNPSAALTFGKNKYYKTDNAEESFLNTEVKLDSTLDQYTSFIKFVEQAFEWEIMSYYFYPYYWGNRNNWDKMYQFDDNDPTFRAFMQSGMARVIVTVRPGFEEAVRHYLATGQIWNGGEIPVIDDPLFLSIVDEMRKTEGEKYGKAWATRLPTALTILQAQSIGLNVTKALPFDDNLSDYEDPTKVPQSSEITPNDAQIGGDSDTQKTGSIAGSIKGLDGLLPEIMLKNMDKSPVDFTNPDDGGDFFLQNIPVGKYEICLDENEDLNNQYNIISGKVTRVIEVKEGSTTEASLIVKRI
ncbi:hypothetical protein [Chryseobacterium sp. EO14]|uniref:hypothetical protein n=1 Tax=Chryseobacterium sp. EO14 TaxID=2950551 RepID=UPI00210C97BC|nr:hypothetical protein [Chryseobacterium sp. EO14]MCQ4139086.1 hypothetical protein [Chryseobacterium sp. EO14]